MLSRNLCDMGSIEEIKSQKEIVLYINTESQPLKTESQPQLHNRKQISRMVVSPDMSYVVTYSESDKSISGWLVDIEKDGQQNVDLNFDLKKSYEISSFVLYKKILIFFYNNKANGHHYRKCTCIK